MCNLFHGVRIRLSRLCSVEEGKSQKRRISKENGKTEEKKKRPIRLSLLKRSIIVTYCLFESNKKRFLLTWLFAQKKEREREKKRNG